MHKNFHHLSSDDKERVDFIIKDVGGTLMDHMSSYINGVGASHIWRNFI